MKGMYDNLDCTACGAEEETQEHVIKCKKLSKNKEKIDENYEKLFNVTENEKLIIARIFKENYDVLENMKK